jgi:hypothetical protein
MNKAKAGILKISSKVNRNTKVVPNPKAATVVDTFKRDFEFVKPHAAKYPTGKWEREYAMDPYAGDYIDDRSKNFIVGKPHTFKACKNKGALRVSGHKGAHQIGKRAK